MTTATVPTRVAKTTMMFAVTTSTSTATMLKTVVVIVGSI